MEPFLGLLGYFTVGLFFCGLLSGLLERTPHKMDNGKRFLTVIAWPYTLVGILLIGIYKLAFHAGKLLSKLFTK